MNMHEVLIVKEKFPYSIRIEVVVIAVTWKNVLEMIQIHCKKERL